MLKIKVAAPAKINLTLEVLNKREDGFHNIKSIMQAISLFDYLTFTINDSINTQIILNGNSREIPYDSKNLVYKAISKFLETSRIKNKKIEVYIEKNIPVEAGLAGGSTDAAAAFFALNKVFDNPLSETQINVLCASLGSDLNFCLYGGTALCTGRGENIKRINTPDINVTLIKPTGFGISAKEAYTKFANMPDKDKVNPDNSEKIAENTTEKFDASLLFNSLEKAVINDYPELLEIKKALPESIMSGSGPTFFVLNNKSPICFDKSRFITIENLKSISAGVFEVC